jgi:hypothetical protein
MKIKNIFLAGLMCCGLAAVLTGCSKDEDPFFTIGGADAPRILNTDFERSNPDDEDSPILFQIDRNKNFTFTLQVTPTDQTTVTWYIDGKEVATGKQIDIPLETGTYTFKVVARSESGAETYRQGTIKVNPLGTDPVSSQNTVEMIQAPGKLVKLTGSNLSSIVKVKVGDREIPVTAADDGSLQYTLPTDMAEGEYRLSMLNAAGESFGGGLVKVSSAPTITAAYFIPTLHSQFDVFGLQLDKIESVTVNGQACTIVSQGAERMTIQMPDMPDGTYEMKATAAGGGVVKFVNGNELAETATVEFANVFALMSNFIGQAGDKLTITGIRLNQVSTVTVNGMQCNIVQQGEYSMTIELPMLEGTFDIKAIAANGTSVKFLDTDKFVEAGSVKLSLVAEDVLWEGSQVVDWDTGATWDDDGTVTAILKQKAAPRATLRLYVKRTATDYCLACAAVDWADIVKGGKDGQRGDVSVAMEDSYVDFVLTSKSFELLNSGNLQVVGHGFTLQKITLIEPAEEELWTGSQVVDWDTGATWDDDGAVSNVLKQQAGVGTTLRLYVKRTATDYCLACAAVDWADIVNGGKDAQRGDVSVAMEDTYVDFVLTAKSFELLSGGNLQVVGHGFTLQKITIK